MKGCSHTILTVREISDEQELYRRIHPDHIKNETITSAAFKRTEREASVDVVAWTTIKKSLSFARHPDTKLGILVTGVVRQTNHQDVIHNPIPDNCAHALIVGDKTSSICKRLARSCQLMVQTSNPTL